MGRRFRLLHRDDHYNRRPGNYPGCGRLLSDFLQPSFCANLGILVDLRNRTSNGQLTGPDHPHRELCRHSRRHECHPILRSSLRFNACTQAAS